MTQQEQAYYAGFQAKCAEDSVKQQEQTKETPESLLQKVSPFGEPIIGGAALGGTLGYLLKILSGNKYKDADLIGTGLGTLYGSGVPSTKEAAFAQGFADKCAQYGVDPELMAKEAARGDMVKKLLNELNNNPFFTNKVITPGKTVKGVKGWQAEDVGSIVGGNGSRTSRWFDSTPTESVIPPRYGDDLLKELRNLLEGSSLERGGGWFDNAQKDVAEKVREIRKVRRNM